jgi:drug/metabolite transporter (DMT)-like permease
MSTPTEVVVMALSMAVMMAASALPFFFAYGRDSRRPVATTAVVLVYVATWALIGFALDYVMSMVMMPSSFLIAAVAVAVAVVYALLPWGRWARDRCRDMARRRPRGPRFEDALADGASYTACCIVCSAGIMLGLVVVGMSNPLVVVTGAAVMLIYKVTPWPVPALSRSR